MIRIVVIGDIHDYRERLDAALALVAKSSIDLVLLVGDLGCDPPWPEPERRLERRAHDASLVAILRTVGQSCGCPVAFVPGNHDLRDAAHDAGARNVDGRVEVFGNLLVAGLGGAGPDRFGFPYEWSEAEAGARLAEIERVAGARRLDVLLSHAPPLGTPLDVTVRGDHVGSEAVRESLSRARPRLFVCGHIHEAWGAHELNGVPCLNAGSLGEPYGQVLAWTIDWEDGPRCITSHCDLDVGVSVSRQCWPVGS